MEQIVGRLEQGHSYSCTSTAASLEPRCGGVVDRLADLSGDRLVQNLPFSRTSC